jgi:hypothetical protein
MAVEVLHASLLNKTLITFEGIYALIPARSPPFKIILELDVWNGLQSCRRITPDVINIISVVKMPSFKYFLYLRQQKKSNCGQDPVNWEGVEVYLLVY